jgi:hypothetical protein
MPRIQHLFFTLLILTLLGLTVVSASSNQGLRHATVAEAIAQEKLRFQELLDSVEPSSLHEVLHQHMKDKYKHGVYQEDKHAMEVVHQENADVAHSLIELAKRQNNTTAIVTTTATTSTETTTGDLSSTQTSSGVATTTSENSQPPPTTKQSSQPATTLPGGSTGSQAQQTSSAPSSVQPKNSASPSTNGTFLGGPAAYPFAPPPPLPSSPAYFPFQNSSFSVTAAPSSYAPSVSAYQFVQGSKSSSAVPASYVLNNSSVVLAPSAAPTSYVLNSSFISPASPSATTTSCTLNSSSIISPFTTVSASPPYSIPSNCSNSTSSFSDYVFNSTSGAATPPVSSTSSGSRSSPQSPSSSSSGLQGYTSSPSSTSSARDTSSNKATVKSTSSPDKASTPASPSRSVTQQILYTTTLANGAVSTVTSVTVVPADIAQTAGGNGGTSTNTGTASLQTNSAISGKVLGINGVLGALGLIVVVGGL